MLSLTFLGVGGAFAKRHFNANALLEHWNASPQEQSEPDDVLLIDFGVTGPLALYQLSRTKGFEYLSAGGQVDYRKINHLLVTHQHADHIGGIEELALVRTFVLSRDATPPPRPFIVSPSSILVDLWDTSLKGGLGPLPGRYATLADYFRIVSLKPSQAGVEPYRFADRYRIEFFPTDHIRIERKYDWPSYGLEIFDDESGRSVFFSGDTRFDSEAYGDRMARADLCFHDAQLGSELESVHALISELRTLADAVKSKTHLYHFSDDWDDPKYAFVCEEFAGFALPRRRYMLFE